jgi:hypothetical protein
MLFNVKHICHVVYTGNQIAHIFRFKFRKNKHISLFGRYNIKFEIFSKIIQYTDLGTATLRSQAIIERSSAQLFPSKSSMFSSFAVNTQMYVQKCMPKNVRDLVSSVNNVTYMFDIKQHY